MTTIEQVCEKFLAYDGDCPMCTSTIELVLRLGLVRRSQLRSNHVLEGGELETVRAAGIRNQLVVLDPRTGETRAGSDALLWIIGDNFGHPWWIRVLGLPGMRHALRWGYEAISYNRRVISPPKRQIVCDCEPEVTLARRLTLVVPLVAFTCVMLGFFAGALFYAAEWGSTLDGAAVSSTALAILWITLGAAAVAVLRGEQRIDYLAHIAVTMFVGALFMLPAAIVIPFLPRETALVAAVIVGAASTWLMIAMLRRRLAAIRLSLLWLTAWCLAMCGGIAFAIYWSFPQVSP